MVPAIDAVDDMERVNQKVHEMRKNRKPGQGVNAKEKRALHWYTGKAGDRDD